MAVNHYVELKRGLVSVAGDDRRAFLQGLISQNVDRLSSTCAAYGALLTPQGKYLHDFCLAEIGERIILDGEDGRSEDLASRLARYKLRSKVVIEAMENFAVFAVFGDGASAAFDLPDTRGAARPIGDGIVFVDPRSAELGCRLILPPAQTTAIMAERSIEPAAFANYDTLRIGLGVPDGVRDMDVEKSTLLECNFDALNGIDWDKGCYVGQEVTARTKYRGLVKRQLIAVTLHGDAPSSGTAVSADGKDVGEIRSVGDGVAIASLRLDALASAKTGALQTADGVRITPKSPISSQ